MPAERFGTNGHASRVSEARELSVHVEHPTPSDGPAITSLVGRCEGLQPNSPYAYVMLSDVFRETSLVLRHVELGIIGFATAFVRPDDPSRLFLWQIGIDPRMRGRGLASRLLRGLVETPRASAATTLETTIAHDNDSFLALLVRFARAVGSSLERIGRYEAEWLGSGHPPENLYEVRLAPAGAAG